MYQTISCLLLTGLLVAVTAVAQATDPTGTRTHSETTTPVDATTRDATTQDQAWGVAIAPPPDILRLHCQPLRGQAGVWVRQVDPNGRAAALGIRAGDIMLSANGRMLVASTPLPEPDQVADLVVLRRGQVRFVASLHQNLPPFPMDNDWMLDQSVTASSFSDTLAGALPNDESGAVAISQVGDQINLQMTLPELGRQPARFRGTREQIEQQLEKSDLTTDGKRRVRRALNQSR